MSVNTMNKNVQVKKEKRTTYNTVSSESQSHHTDISELLDLFTKYLSTRVSLSIHFLKNL